MSEASGTPATVRPTLSERLQAVTEALAAAATPDAVFGVVLKPALQALDAIAGTVLLVTDAGDRLQVAAMQGHAEGGQSVWQDGPLDTDLPAGDALAQHEALFFEHPGDLKQAYPELEARTGGIAAVASAVLPMFLDGQPLGVLVLDFREPHDFPEEEQRFLRILASQSAIALGRARLTADLEGQVAERTRELEEEKAALEAFARFTEEAADTTDVLALARRAVRVLRESLGATSAAYFELSGDHWQAQVLSDDFPPAVVAPFRRGIPATTRSFLRPVEERRAVFINGWDAEAEGLPGSHDYGAVARYPFFRGGQPCGMLGMGTMHARQWTQREMAVFRAVGRSLGLALERAEQLRQLEEERRRLEAANEELVAFTYSVSHDLRTPVRHASSFAGLLRQSLGEGVNAKSARYLTVIEEAAARMNALIDGVLQVSRASRLTLKRESVDLGAVVAVLRRELEVRARERQVVWEVAPLPVVTGDEATLRLVLTNLLDNALKFTRTREVARIEVWAEERPEEWAVFVRDNGVGFDQKYVDRLFGIFQRLHRTDEFEGAGVGLANVRRIIARHGGRVTASGQLGEGATFGFTLPRQRSMAGNGQEAQSGG
ncbi:sensor histidine kinase [Deinococcus petrolearius]|uniref:histidine kinase n=1 Tax=Deinococcus petrolearius TaxID=1751295 RepID=A0ABW1DL18_9DEIO